MKVKKGDKARLNQNIYYVHEEIQRGGLLSEKEFHESCWVYLEEGTVVTALNSGDVNDVMWEGGGRCTGLSEKWLERII